MTLSDSNGNLFWTLFIDECLTISTVVSHSGTVQQDEILRARCLSPQNTAVACNLRPKSKRAHHTMKHYTFGALCFLLLVPIRADAEQVDGTSDIATCSKSRVHSEPRFSYTGLEPQNWGDQNPEFSKCKTGTTQSPVNIMVNYTKGTTNAPLISQALSVLKYEPTTQNFKFSCASNFGECSHVRLGNKTYSMISMHFHSPSENHLSGRAYPLELHMVHKSGNDLAVVGIFFEVGETKNAELEHLLIAADKQNYAVVDLSKLSTAHSADTCMFDGSLTTPPCSEGVKWVVSTEVMKASVRQIGEYREMCDEKPNNRPLQNMNGRLMTCYAKANGVIAV